MNAILEAALSWASRGFRVLPVHGIVDGVCTCTDGRDCGKSAGKHPILKQWIEKATRDEKTIRGWFADHPERNIGLAMGGEERFVALDVDGEEGRASLVVLCERYGKLPVTLTMRSGRTEGGAHYIFRCPDALELPTNRVAIGKGLDERSTGGQIIAPPSMHASGKRYVIERDVPIAELPEWLHALAIAPKQKHKGEPAVSTTQPSLSPVPLEERVRRARAYVRPIEGAVEGQPVHAGGLTGGTMTFVLCEKIARGFDLDADTTHALLLEEWNARCSPPWDERELRRKVESAITTGTLARGSLLNAPSTRHFRLTELGNAERLVATHGRDLRFCKERGWMAWDSARWIPNAEVEVQRKAALTVRSMYAAASQENDDDKRKQLVAWAHKSESNASLNAMVSRARYVDGVAAPTDQFDDGKDAHPDNPWLLTCANGTLDLRTGELRAHRREDLITRIAPVRFDPSASAPAWERFLCEAQPDPLVRAFLARLTGYAATGVIREHVLPIHFGSGGNGKGTYNDTLMALLGDYARAVPTELVKEKQQDGHPSDRATLYGCRYAAASETEKGCSLSVAIVKVMTGGDTMTARFMHKDWFEFQPTHKLSLLTNHRPRIKDTTDSIWRRVLLVTWGASFIGREDTALREKLTSERAGILNWIVRGCLEWQRIGLAPPKSVQLATSHYRDTENPVARFVADACDVAPSLADTAFSLYQAYKRWCEANGERYETSRGFNEALRERGFKVDRRDNQGRIVFAGLALRTNRAHDERSTAPS
jgi:putative DNA primase/helicase